MNGWLLTAVAVVYLVVAGGYARRREWGMCVAFVAYALANVGFIIELVRHD